MFKSLLQWLFYILLLGLAAPAASHTYFFGLTELSVNPNNRHIEVIHQFTAHDIDNAIAEIEQIAFSPAHPKYELYIRKYLEQNFQLSQKNQPLTLNWVGLEINKGKVIIYQEVDKHSILTGLVVKNDLLIDTYAKQINTVNYQDNTLSGSLTFTDSKRIVEIADKN
ncbi:MAG: hypothetical protein HRT37_11605 [Alteromonadaceae bacterium]|nr:hypothetical protein [Alteromonadaceae bacterium]